MCKIFICNIQDASLCMPISLFLLGGKCKRLLVNFCMASLSSHGKDLLPIFVLNPGTERRSEIDDLRPKKPNSFRSLRASLQNLRVNVFF